jgi:hypothetical protein
MNLKDNKYLYIVIALVIGYVLSKYNINIPTAVTVNDDLGTTVRFQTCFNGNKEDAYYFSDSLDHVADVLEQEQGLICNREDVTAIYSRLGTLNKYDKHSAGKYPMLPGIIGGTFVDQKFPDSPGPLTPDETKLAIKIFRGLATGMRNVK